MTWNSPAVLEVKFACPRCEQHLACDPAYCGAAIECPSCHGSLTVPSMLAFAPPSRGGVPTPPPAGENEWRQGGAESQRPGPAEASGSIALQSWFWFFFLEPLLLFFAGGGFAFRWLAEPVLVSLMAVCGVVAGFLLAKMTSTSLMGFIAGGILFTALLVAADAFVCFFGGCAMACTQAAGRGI